MSNPASSTPNISAPLKGSLQHYVHGDIKPERCWGTPENLNDSGSWRTGPARDREVSNLQRMAGMSQSLESVLSGQRPRAHTVGALGLNQQGRLMSPGMAACRVQTQQDQRRLSEASLAPPPRPPPLNLKRLNMKPRRPAIQPVPGNSWPPQVVLSPPAQTQPQPQHPPQQSIGGSNLVKMAHMARSTPQLDENTDNRERDRERERVRYREKLPNGQSTKDSLTSQIMEAVHGVTIEEVHAALQRNEWNPVRAEQQLKLDQMYMLSLCSREECLKILTRYQWNLQLASRYLMRGSGEKERPPVSTERRV